MLKLLFMVWPVFKQILQVPAGKHTFSAFGL